MTLTKYTPEETIPDDSIHCVGEMIMFIDRKDHTIWISRVIRTHKSMGQTMYTVINSNVIPENMLVLISPKYLKRKLF